ncbi:ATP phosphoribosyltransferase [Hyphobacterium sp. HN65]|uniref:ATP phosphoribosyltransferase n=1 Tax=Hyphobacterium lacteum TaxID=3116575 RepID=A0ABU7LSC2_9PROT|nr:ATP phosphoribosyltransferase [Hyphobacterium sp. HN65]MEE2526820.1 ATP phosphoribosyltransferase [Hyphobacterium sp. HN65]
MSERMRLAIQSKGRLADGSLELLGKAGVRFNNSRDALWRPAANFDLDLMLVRDDDIPGLVLGGAADYGIVGENVLAELQAGDPRFSELEIVLPLEFASCRLDVATPVARGWSSLTDLDGQRIATSYPALTRAAFKDAGIDVEIISMNGSVEVAPRLGIADAICDLVSSGATLKANNLASIATLLESQAVLIRPKSGRTSATDRIAETLMDRLRGVLASAQTKYIMLNAPTDRLADIQALLPGSDAPTVARIAGRDDVVAVQAVCRERVFWETLERLKQAGARAILVLPIEKMMA